MKSHNHMKGKVKNIAHTLNKLLDNSTKPVRFAYMMTSQNQYSLCPHYEWKNIVRWKNIVIIFAS